ncbi:hypothetical protein AA313_de0202575 [Arthrobotrys entomopaga]|nr:hypothetical protein AA313_de0202575 [Arthrobotrys entomopaga]
MQFPIYEEVRRRIYNRRVVTAISAASAGAIAATITTPLDVVKTRMMLLKKGGKAGSAGLVETAQSIVRNEGGRAIWKGGLLRAVWTAVGSGLYLGTFECSKIYLSRRRERRETESLGD